MLLELTLVAVLSVHTIPTDELEQLYWDCDTAYMRQELGGQDMSTCLKITEEFLDRRFNSDYRQLQDYWRLNKDLEWSRRNYSES